MGSTVNGEKYVTEDKIDLIMPARVTINKFPGNHKVKEADPSNVIV